MAAFGNIDRRWGLLVPVDAEVIATTARPAALATLRALRPGTPVALVGGRRLRTLARRGQVRIAAEYIALPSLETPVAISQRQPGPLRWTALTVLTVPSGITGLHAPAWFAVRLVRAVPALLSWAPAGDRILVGTRS